MIRFWARRFGDKPLDDRSARDALRQIFDAAVESAAPAPAVIENLPSKPTGRCVVVGTGKASAAMAAALDSAWPDVPISGVVSTRYGHAVAVERVEVIEAGHPIPDAASEAAARRALDAVQGLTEDDLVIALISGGGSATMALPVEAITLEEKQDVTRQLLRSGASINEMNVVRGHLSRIKAGKLAAAAAPARVHTLIISDVPGDNPANVASGPTIVGDATPTDALEIIERCGIVLPARAHHHLQHEPPSAAEQSTGTWQIIASPALALRAASEAAKRLKLTPMILGDAIEAESRELARAMVGIAQSVRSLSEPVRAPAVLLSGGETAVTIGPEGAGRGGRNMEFALSFANAAKGMDAVWVLAGDSDGIDGTEDAAGAIVDPTTLSRARAAGFDPDRSLRNHDSYTLFEEIDDLVVTGPTLTNVNDIRIVVVA